MGRAAEVLGRKYLVRVWPVVRCKQSSLMASLLEVDFHGKTCVYQDHSSHRW